MSSCSSARTCGLTSRSRKRSRLSRMSPSDSACALVICSPRGQQLRDRAHVGGLVEAEDGRGDRARPLGRRGAAGIVVEFRENFVLGKRPVAAAAVDVLAMGKGAAVGGG